jgi:nitrogen fixation/metabolism regulation signal transduction histidine kinase
VVLLAYELARWCLPTARPLLVGALSLVVSLPLTFVLAGKVVLGGLRTGILAVSDGLLNLRENTYNLHLAVDRNDEVGTLVHRFNQLAELLRQERNERYQREMLPETILGATSMAVLLCNEARRVVFANPAAREFFAGTNGPSTALEGRDARELFLGTPAEVQAAVENPGDGLFSYQRPGSEEPETYHLTKRYFEFSQQQHTLYVLRPLTRELARKEVETWKKAIRVLSHEVNNSLAPITSLVQTARMMLDNPAHAQRLRGALDTIEERASHLKTFLDGYASFARLPQPTKQLVPWATLLAGIEGLYPFKLVGEPPARPAFIDPAQMQQVLINLLKNAAESGSPAEEIALHFTATTDTGVEFEVVDRGRGMTAEVLGKALLPFYSTKKTGTGLGLSLCREIVDAHGGRLSLHRREAGGVAARCWLPHGPA